MADNLPVLDQPSRGALKREMVKGYSIAEADRLSSLPLKTIRSEIASKMADLGALLTRRECDGCLQDLALVLPRANLGPDEIDRMLDLYFGLLRESGVTKPMLQAAAKAYVMAPMKGKPRFFPDPGQLAELCADGARSRREALAALQGALGVLDGPSQASDSQTESFDVTAGLRALSEKMRVKTAVARSAEEGEIHRPAASTPSTARPNTDAAELREHISKRTGHAA